MIRCVSALLAPNKNDKSLSIRYDSVQIQEGIESPEVMIIIDRLSTRRKNEIKREKFTQVDRMT